MRACYTSYNYMALVAISEKNDSILLLLIRNDFTVGQTKAPDETGPCAVSTEWSLTLT